MASLVPVTAVPFAVRMASVSRWHTT